MAVFTGSIVVDFAISVLTLSVFLVLYLNSKYKYWKIRGFPYVKPEFFYGNFRETLQGKKSMVDVHSQIYKELKGERFGGFFDLHVPNLMILDPELIQKIMVKDFKHFHDKGLFAVDVANDPMTNSLPNLEGHAWRYQRNKLSPTFSSGKLKAMMDQIYNCGDDLMEELEKYANNGEAVEAKDVLSIFTSDVIASCAFGLQFKVNSSEGETFKYMASNAFGKSRFALLFMVFLGQYRKMAKLLGLRIFSKEITDFFINLSKETVRYRTEKGIKRNDFLQLLMKLKEEEESGNISNKDETEEEVDDLVNQLQEPETNQNEQKSAKVMTDDWVASNSFLFLVAGSEVSTTLSVILFSLGQNPAVQTRLQQEVDTVMAHKTLNYETLKDMVYMDQVIQETLRLYPIGGLVTRRCTIPYRIPDSDLLVEKGVKITIPVWPIHTDPQHYSNPEVFDPERFVNNNYKPSPTYLPFGDGPRICIGMRFAILAIKTCLARIMSQYSVKLSSETSKIKWDPEILFPRPADGVWVRIQKRQ